MKSLNYLRLCQLYLYCYRFISHAYFLSSLFSFLLLLRWTLNVLTIYWDTTRFVYSIHGLANSLFIFSHSNVESVVTSTIMHDRHDINNEFGYIQGGDRRCGYHCNFDKDYMWRRDSTLYICGGLHSHSPCHVTLVVTSVHNCLFREQLFISDTAISPCHEGKLHQCLIWSFPASLLLKRYCLQHQILFIRFHHMSKRIFIIFSYCR